MGTQLAENAPPGRTRAAPKDTADRDNQETEKNLRKGDCDIRMIQDPAKRRCNVVPVLEDIISRIRNTQIPDTNKMPHKSGTVGDRRILLETSQAGSWNGQVRGTGRQRRFVTYETRTVADKATFALADHPTERTNMKARDEAPQPAGEHHMIAELLLFSKFLKNHRTNRSKGRMIIVDVTKGRLRERALKNTGKRSPLRSQTIGSIDIHERIARKRRTITNDIEGIKDCGPITRLVSVLPPQPPNQIPMMEIETQQRTRQELRAKSIDRLASRCRPREP